MNKVGLCLVLVGLSTVLASCGESSGICNSNDSISFGEKYLKDEYVYRIMNGESRDSDEEDAIYRDCSIIFNENKTGVYRLDYEYTDSYDNERVIYNRTYNFDWDFGSDGVIYCSYINSNDCFATNDSEYSSNPFRYPSTFTALGNKNYMCTTILQNTYLYNINWLKDKGISI